MTGTLENRKARCISYLIYDVVVKQIKKNLTNRKS